MRSDDLSHRSGERDYIMADFCLDLLDAFQFEVGALADGFGRIPRYQSSFGQRLGRRHLDSKPVAEPVLLAPNAPHLGTGISRDHVPPIFLKIENRGL